MPHRLAPDAETELDGIWYYIAKESGSMDVADRFYLLANTPISADTGTRICAPACAASR